MRTLQLRDSIWSFLLRYWSCTHQCSLCLHVPDTAPSNTICMSSTAGPKVYTTTKSTKQMLLRMP